LDCARGGCAWRGRRARRTWEVRFDAAVMQAVVEKRVGSDLQV
jgi:hypothetical protein